MVVVIDVIITILDEFPQLGSHDEQLQGLQQQLPRQPPRNTECHKTRRAGHLEIDIGIPCWLPGSIVFLHRVHEEEFQFPF